MLASAACLIHVTITNKRVHGSVWLILSGACAALAATIDPAAVVFVLLFGAVILALRWTPAQRVGGLLVYLLGAAGPLLLHAALVAAHHRQRLAGLRARPRRDRRGQSARRRRPSDVSVDIPRPKSRTRKTEPSRRRWQPLWARLGRVAAAFVGRHGVLSHFPVVLLGIIGVTMVMHRHWPSTTKVLASATLAGALVIILLVRRCGDRLDAGDVRHAVVRRLPAADGLLGRRLAPPPAPRRRRGCWPACCWRSAWSVSLLGATGPLPQEGFSRYTAAGAAKSTQASADG